MLLIEASNIRKYFSDRLIISIDNLKIYMEDRIGIVGANGAGKTTFMNILSGRLKPDEGTVQLYGQHAYITQLQEPETEPAGVQLDGQIAKELGVSQAVGAFMSGGEKTRMKIARGLSEESVILFADEPTSNLDINAIGVLEKRLSEYRGALLIVSHDRMLLDKLCSRIFEVADGGIRVYNGNYSDYRRQKKAEEERQEFEYEEYVSKKSKLEAAVTEKNQKAGSMKKTPSRMGNSEARLHKMGNQKAKANLERTVKAIRSRIDKLEVKERLREMPKAVVDLREAGGITSKTALSVRGLSKRFGSRVLLDDVEFEIPKGKRTALIGDNGTGKTTLLGMIVEGSDGIRPAPGVKPGYFRQNLDNLREELSILENVMRDSIYPEGFARNILAGLLFRREEIYKKVKVLSGGERVRVCFAKLLVSDVNFIILDEPTNYLDLYSMEAVENALKEYNGTVLFVSHDRSFISSVAERILLLENGKITSFEGSYEEFTESRQKASGQQKDDAEQRTGEQLLLLENRMTELLGRLSAPTRKDDVQLLDAEYKSLLAQLRELKNKTGQ